MRPRWLVCGAAIFLLALLEVSVVAAGIGRFSSAAAARREASPTVVTSVKGPPLQDSTSEHSTVAATDVSPAPGAGNLPAAPTTEHDVQAGNHVPEPTTSGIAHSPDGDAILAGVPPLQTESSLLAAFAPSPAVAAVVQAGDDSLSDTAFQALIQAALRCQYDQGRSAAAAEAELADRVASTGDDAPAASLAEEGGEDDGDDEEEEEERRVDARHPEEDQRACNRLRLRVALIRDYRARIAARDHAASAQVRESDLQGDMATVALASTGGAGFEGFFFDYEVPGKPVLIRTDASDQPPLHGVDAVDAAATWAEIRAGWNAMQALFPAPARPWSSCCRHHDRLLLPASAWNNYLPRLERLASEKPHRRQHPLDIRAAQDEASAFPRLLALGGGEVVPLHREPNAYHCFVTPLDHGIDVVVYPRPEADKLDQDVLGRFTMRDPFHGSTTPQHARSVSTSAAPGDHVFIPAGAASSWKISEDASATTNTTHGFVAQFCFVDASNLNAVRQALMVAGLADLHRAALHRLLRQPGLDTEMVRNPTVITVADASRWPRPPPRTTKQAAVDDADAQDDGLTPAQRRMRRNRQRRAARSGKLKKWQTDKRWAWRMRLMTMPAPTDPEPIAVGRTSITLGFTCPMLGDAGHKHDGKASDDEEHVIVGYTVAWSSMCAGADATVEALSVHEESVGAAAAVTQAATMGGTPSTTTRDVPADLADMLSRSLAGFDVYGARSFRFDDEDGTPTIEVGCGGHDDRLCVNITSLNPGHSYTFRVAALMKQGASTFSEQSPPVTTGLIDPPGAVSELQATALSAGSVRLDWESPTDSGGLPVIGHLVRRGRQDNMASSDMIVAGPDTSLAIGALLPGSTYQFAVAAISQAGIGPFSAATPALHLNLRDGGAAVHEVVGFDPQMMVGEVTAHTEAARMTWEEEDYLVAAAYDVVLKHAEDVGLRLPTPETDTVTPTGRAGAVSRPPRRPKSRQPALPPVSVLGRLHRGVAYFAGDAPPTAFAIDADGSVSVVETPGTAPGAPDFMVPCFGPPALLSDTTESLRFLGHELRGWASFFSPRAYDVRAELVAASPLTGLGSLRNADAMKQRIVYFERGEVPLRNKVLAAASAGALGVVIGDNSKRCDTAFDQVCVRGSDQANGEGFASTDAPRLWNMARIPTLLVNRAAAAHIREVLRIEQ